MVNTYIISVWIASGLVGPLPPRAVLGICCDGKATREFAIEVFLQLT